MTKKKFLILSIILQRILCLFSITRYYYCRSVLSGILTASKLNLAICLLVSDNKKNLKKNLEKLIDLHLYFSNVKIHILDSSKSKRTQKILAQYAQKHTFISVYSLADCLEDSAISEDPATALQQHNKMSPQYIRAMALLRDLLLNKAKSNKKYAADVFLQADINVFKISPANILHSFGEYDRWDCVLANGRRFDFINNPLVYNCFADSFALLPIEAEEKPKLDLDIRLQTIYAPLTKHMPLFPVKSAFGGLGIYKKEIIKAGSYSQSVEKDNFQFSEHVSFFSHLSTENPPRVYINPKMLVWHNSFWGAMIKAAIKGKNVQRA